MKKILFLFLLLPILFMLPGCGESRTNPKKDIVTIEPKLFTYDDLVNQTISFEWESVEKEGILNFFKDNGVDLLSIIEDVEIDEPNILSCEAEFTNITISTDKKLALQLYLIHKDEYSQANKTLLIIFNENANGNYSIAYKKVLWSYNISFHDLKNDGKEEIILQQWFYGQRTVSTLMILQFVDDKFEEVISIPLTAIYSEQPDYYESTYEIIGNKIIVSKKFYGGGEYSEASWLQKEEITTYKYDGKKFTVTVSTPKT